MPGFIETLLIGKSFILLEGPNLELLLDGAHKASFHTFL